jgi:N-acetylglucosaminyl-diphospho-decaprenol L-rhamnosyltransferase
LTRVKPRVSVLIASYNTRPLLLEAIGSVVHQPGAEIIVVDNASTDGSADAVSAAFPDVCLVRNAQNLGFAAASNRAASRASGDLLLLLNPDARLLDGALAALLECIDAHPRAAAVGPALIYADGTPQPAAFRFPGLMQIGLDLFPVARLMDSPLNGRLHHAGEPRQVDHPLGACMLIRRSAWDDVGPLDEGYFMYLEEVDWCRRARRRDWHIWYTPHARAVHHAGSATRQQPGAMFAQLWRSRLRYYQRHHGPLFNRAVHALVRVGLAARAPDTAEARNVRQLVL